MKCRLLILALAEGWWDRLLLVDAYASERALTFSFPPCCTNIAAAGGQYIGRFYIFAGPKWGHRGPGYSRVVEERS